MMPPEEVARQRKLENGQTEPKKKRVPEWATRPIGAHLDHQQELARILHFSISGISTRVEAVVAPTKFRWLEEGREGEPQPDKEKLDRAARERDFAQREIDKDFPILHEQ